MFSDIICNGCFKSGITQAVDSGVPYIAELADDDRDNRDDVMMTMNRRNTKSEN